MLEHRLVMERHVGRKLLTSEHVHHKNGDKKDNRLENLELLTASEHMRLEMAKRYKDVPKRNCLHCGNEFQPRGPYRSRLKCCSKKCQYQRAGYAAAKKRWGYEYAT